MAMIKCPNGHHYDSNRFSSCPVCTAERPTGTFEDERTVSGWEPGRNSEAARRDAESRNADGEINEERSNMPTSTVFNDDLDKTIGNFESFPKPAFSNDDRASKNNYHDPEMTIGTGVPSGFAPQRAASAGNVRGFSNFNSEKTLPLDLDYMDERTGSVFIDMSTKEFNPVVGWLVCIDGPEKGRDYRLRSGKNFLGRGTGMALSIPDDPKIHRENHFSVVFDPNSAKWYIVPGAGTSTYYNGKLLEDYHDLNDKDKIRAGNSDFIFKELCGEDFKW